MKHRQILFIQGGGAGAYREDRALVSALRDALGTGYEIRYPHMPREEDPDYELWKRRLARELAALRPGALLIGHSLGGSFLLKFVSEEKMGTEVAGLFLLATPYLGGKGWCYEGYEKVALLEGWQARWPRIGPIFIYHARDDEVAPFAHMELYANKFPQAVTRAFDTGGHQLKNDLSEVAADIATL
jgi:predicted alpha/beta hydrolase family esterase